ncbi:hypothetical protein E8E12_008303 [Didymella heteroderae]|uniref:Uncharacterized protein n=1 Tax=Didymella heteroderae TaxID=1769908 RepID=A0A9P5C2S2_9PLEO|nr:hypothetical protein E8E12_008303 [Didymella heteroderae]
MPGPPPVVESPPKQSQAKKRLLINYARKHGYPTLALTNLVSRKQDEGPLRKTRRESSVPGANMPKISDTYDEK